MNASTTLESADLHVLWDIAPGAAVRGTLVVLTGRGEHPGVYERFGRRLSADNYRVHVIDGTDHTRAAALASEVLDRAEVEKPRVLVGSDAGATQALALVADGRRRSAPVDAAVVAALPLNGASSELSDREIRSACPVHQEVLNEPGNLDAGALKSAVDTADVVAPENVEVPVLVFHGGNDPVVDVESARVWATRLPWGQFVSTREGLRDVLNDKGHRSVAARIVLFLEDLGQGGPILDEHR